MKLATRQAPEAVRFACLLDALFTDQVRSLGGRTFLNYDLKYTGALILDFYLYIAFFLKSCVDVL